MIDGAWKTTRIYGRLHLRKTDKTLSKGEYVIVCFPGARIKQVTERIDNTLGHGQGGSILVHVGMNNADNCTGNN